MPQEFSNILQDICRGVQSVFGGARKGQDLKIIMMRNDG